MSPEKEQQADHSEYGGDSNKPVGLILERLIMIKLYTTSDMRDSNHLHMTIPYSTIKFKLIIIDD